MSGNANAPFPAKPESLNSTWVKTIFCLNFKKPLNRKLFYIKVAKPNFR